MTKSKPQAIVPQSDAPQNDGPQTEQPQVEQPQVEVRNSDQPVAPAAPAQAGSETPPVFADHEDHPRAGGAFIRLPDGSLIEDKEL